MIRKIHLLLSTPSNGTVPPVALDLAWLRDKMNSETWSLDAMKHHFVKHYFQSMWHPGLPLGGDCAHLERLGNAGDGDKVLCGASKLLSGACRVVSVGSHGDFSFENNLHQRAPGCRMDTYDPEKSYAKLAPRFVNFLPEVFQASSAKRYEGKRISVLKIDCEGCEYTALEPFLAATCTDTILLELHGCKVASPRGEQVATSGWGPLRRLQESHKLMSALEADYVVYSAEPNVEWSDGTCVEYGLRRRTPCED